MPNTTNQALPYPALTDPANGPVAVQNLAQAVEKKLVMVFVDAADRAAKLTAPTAGMLSFLTATGLFYYYSGTAWVQLLPTPPTAPVGAAHGTAASPSIVAATNTAASAGSTVVGVTFIAPNSGKVYVNVSGHLQCNTAAQTAYLTYELRDGAVIGSGTVAVAVQSDYGVGIGGPGVTRASLTRRMSVTGLTPGNSYNARTMHFVTGGNADYYRREILVEPVI